MLIQFYFSHVILTIVNLMLKEIVYNYPANFEDMRKTIIIN
jgi:hypothetical protein